MVSGIAQNICITAEMDMGGFNRLCDLLLFVKKSNGSCINTVSQLVQQLRGRNIVSDGRRLNSC